jgi:maltose alpha-D-glucosyltransferase/alpha-amylase
VADLDDDLRQGGHRRALAVATGHYRHASLPNLESPAKDAAIMQRVLADPLLGGFDPVGILFDADLVTVRERIYDFFVSAEPDDFLFAYFSGHGEKDADGRLYLATIETDPERLLPSAVPADYIRDCLDRCRARRVAIVLDCCYAGAFPRSQQQRSDLERVVIVTASPIQRAHEAADESGEALPSVFGSAFFEGIETGAADGDGNGWISVREAFDHARERLGYSGRDQTPTIDSRVGGDLWIARAPVRPGVLPPDVAALMHSGRVGARLMAVEEIGLWLSSPDVIQAATAERALTDLRADPAEEVGLAARRALARHRSTSATGLAEDTVRAPLRDPLWFKKAVFYEVRIRSFADSDGDGVGDLRGVIGKLDYLSWLGVTCLTLSPIFGSPLHDDGYDIDDFVAVNPDLGTRQDLVELIDAAHHKNIRIVLDLVLNHTSDQHEWFKRSQSDPAGPYGDFYVWRDTLDTDVPYASASADTQGWTYDPVRRRHYWHRFLVNEPDLNFDNPAVQEAMLEVMRHWLDLGVDGYRLVSAPYLYEREGTSGEGLTETHDYLKRLRAEVDKLYPGRILIADANRWPTDAVAYFGDDGVTGDECHMVLYTSLIPRIFLAIRRENHEPISEVLTRLPAIPPTCQWGVFLRNSDELSLASLDERERAYLFREYAPAPRMRSETGILRRLAPLADNERSLLELCTALMMSLPGSPVLYYGDEIGMGDNLMLRGGDSVRTPMQWSPDRNAGFSHSEPDRLVLPVLMDSVYGYQATNVEAQRRSRSLLRFTRRIIELRQHNPAFSVGGFQEVASTNPAVFAYIRSYEADQVLCVVNFSRFAQTARLDLAGYAGRTPVEAFGGSRFLPIGRDPYPLNLAGHGFYWLNLPA